MNEDVTPPAGGWANEGEGGTEEPQKAASEQSEQPAVSLVRQLDREVEAELEAALAGFDAHVMDQRGAPRGRAGAEASDAVNTGRVVSVRGKDIFVDLGGKSEGVISTELFEKEGVPEAGSLIEVLVDHYDAEEGLLILTRKGAAALDADWENLREGLIVEARVTGTNKGGLEVRVGRIRGFIPASQADLSRVDDLGVYINETLRCLVIEANRSEKNLVLSRRSLLEQELAEAREKAWADLAEGQVRTGTVRSIKPFGAFVDIGAVEGLLHVSQMSWGRVDDPAQVVQVGQQLEVQIVKLDQEKRKVGLGLKQLLPNPWDRVEEKYPVASTATGRITRLADFGAFCELEPGIEGLIHVSELAPKRVFRVADFVSVGQEVTVRVLEVDNARGRISLSVKAAMQAAEPAPEPEEEEPDETPPPAPLKRKTSLKGGLER